MIKKMQKTICALAVMTSFSLPALAADGVEIKVIGTIAPAACTPTVAGGGVIDYGTIASNSLSSTDYTVLPVKSVDLNVVCSAPSKVALKSVSSRLNSVAGASSENSIGAGYVPNVGTLSSQKVGLGLTTGGAKIGGYSVVVDEILVDGVSADSVLFSDDNGIAWTKTTGLSFPLFNSLAPAHRLLTVSNGTVPESFTTLSTKVKVEGYLNKADEIDLNSPIDLDGLSTIELVYM